MARIAAGDGPTKAMFAAQRGLREVGILRQEPVAGMNALRAGAAGDLDQPLDVEIALARRRRADRKGLVAGAHVQRLGVGLGVDRDGAHPEALRGAGDAHGDLAAVRDEDGREHEPGDITQVMTNGSAASRVFHRAIGAVASVRPSRRENTRSFEKGEEQPHAKYFLGSRGAERRCYCTAVSTRSATWG